MSLFLDVLAWACIVMGTLGGVLTLVTLTIGRAKPSMTKPGARSGRGRCFAIPWCPSRAGRARWSFLRASRRMTLPGGWRSSLR
jgi:hypothetical protein